MKCTLKISKESFMPTYRSFALHFVDDICLHNLNRYIPQNVLSSCLIIVQVAKSYKAVNRKAMQEFCVAKTYEIRLGFLECVA